MSRLDTLLEYLRNDPDDTFTLFAIASEYRKLGENERALEFFERLIDDHPSEVGTYYHMGKLLEAMGESERAVRIYQTGIHVAVEQRDFHARAELQDALLQAQGIGFDDEP